MDNLELSGTLAANLRVAVASAKRLRSHPVHSDTLEFWRALLAHCRAQERAPTSSEAEDVEALMGELQTELATRE
jgi:hypothetical protein